MTDQLRKKGDRRGSAGKKVSVRRRGLDHLSHELLIDGPRVRNPPNRFS